MELLSCRQILKSQIRAKFEDAKTAARGKREDLPKGRETYYFICFRDDDTNTKQEAQLKR